MSILNHVWGESPAADRVWAQVSGLAPRKIPGRLFCVLFQAFFDESFDEDIMVVCGYVDTPEVWSKFSSEWEELLPGVPMDWNRERNFKMSQLAQSDHGRNVLFPACYRLIEKYVRIGVFVVLLERDVRAAKSRIHVPHPDFDLNKVVMDGLDSRYLLCIVSLMLFIKDNRRAIADVIPETSVIDFYFDDRSDKEHVKRAWNQFVGQLLLEERAAWGNEPRFEKEQDFVPLQAADAFAWWTREACEEALVKNQETATVDFGKTLKIVKNPASLRCVLNEEFLTQMYMKKTRESIHPDIPVIDLKTGIII